MYNAKQLPVTPDLVSIPVKLPLNILLAIPDYDSDLTLWRFNVPAAVYSLIGRYRDWRRVTKVMNPRIWAPDWDEDRLRDFVSTPFDNFQFPLEKLRLESLRARAFPGSGSLRNLHRQNYPHYEIIHFIGKMASSADGSTLDLGYHERKLLQAGVLRDALVAAQTRLLVLQVSSQDSFDAEQLAGSIVGGGGPAVLVVYGSNLSTLEEYFRNLYANIVHSGVLPNLAQAAGWLDNSLSVNVFYGLGGEDVFQFKDWMSMLSDQLGRVQQSANASGESLEYLRDLASSRLHRSQAQAFEPRLRLEEKTTDELGLSTNLLTQRLAEVSVSAWDHESEGVIPLSEIAQAIPKKEIVGNKLAVRYPQLSQELEQETARAPRVLNANFADPIRGRVLEPHDGLVADREYDLLVDVGPRWNKLKSVVTGHADFPEEALPLDQDGYNVQIVVVSEDFSPHMTSAQIWVPRQTGRSFPFEDRQRAEHPGPVSLRLRTPVFPPSNDIAAIPAHARLCLYYENNLLQSAVVKAGVVRAEGTVLDEANTVNVDYVLTSSFQEVEGRFARRAVRFTSAEDTDSHPVTLNLTLNDDGANGHRIIINHLIGSDAPFIQPQNACPPRGWTPYDPKAADGSLEESRNQLQSLFYQKDKDYSIVVDKNNRPVLADLQKRQNGKTREQFKRDLFGLALLGSRLYVRAFGQVNPEGAKCPSGEWMRDLEEALKKPVVIQVARANQSNYVFPWALLYSYPMVPAEQDEWQWCDIIDEQWSEEGRRLAPRSEEEAKKRDVCPYHFQDKHGSNIICPYGLWGLKHIIEQPPSVLVKENNEWKLRDVEKDIRTSAKPYLSIGVTRDTNLNPISIKEHLAKLGNLVQINPPEPAEDWRGVRTMLTAPEVVYFLCHGEYDPIQKEQYLSIGPHDNRPSHKISPETLSDWARKPKPHGPNFEEWKKRHPFIFINGCHTVDLKPGQILDFVGAFTIDLTASGVLGTEVSVLLPVATEVAESLFFKLAQGISVGQALYEIRWDLTNKGNLLGLAYTLYGLAGLHLVPE